MTEQDKQLLLIDLCARLPYKVRVEIISYGQENLKPWFGQLSCKDLDCFIHGIAYKSVKPYLRPMSSMTEEEENEYYNIEFGFNIHSDRVDWLNEHHFDHRGLIEKGLALEAPEGMYNLKEIKYECSNK